MQQKDFYNFAKDETGAVTDIATIDESSRHRSKFFCIGCGEEMVPVLGQRRRHHFRHKSLTVNCSYETYLHQLGKEKFKKTTFVEIY